MIFLNHFFKNVVNVEKQAAECADPVTAGYILERPQKLWLEEAKYWDLCLIASLQFATTWIQLQSWKTSSFLWKCTPLLLSIF